MNFLVVLQFFVFWESLLENEIRIIADLQSWELSFFWESGLEKQGEGEMQDIWLTFRLCATLSLRALPWRTLRNKTPASILYSANWDKIYHQWKKLRENIFTSSTKTNIEKWKIFKKDPCFLSEHSKHQSLWEVHVVLGCTANTRLSCQQFDVWMHLCVFMFWNGSSQMAGMKHCKQVAFLNVLYTGKEIARYLSCLWVEDPFTSLCQIVGNISSDKLRNWTGNTHLFSEVSTRGIFFRNASNVDLLFSRHCTERHDFLNRIGCSGDSSKVIELETVRCKQNVSTCKEVLALWTQCFGPAHIWLSVLFLKKKTHTHQCAVVTLMSRIKRIKTGGYLFLLQKRERERETWTNATLSHCINQCTLSARSNFSDKITRLFSGQGTVFSKKGPTKPIPCPTVLDQANHTWTLCSCQLGQEQSTS